MDASDLEGELARLHEACWGWALACCGRDREIAEEALQSAYARILAGQARYDGRASVRTWVFGVIRFAALEELRRSRTWWARAAPIEEADDVATEADGQGGGSSPELVRALARLSPRQREVIQLVFYHEMTIAEASHVMQVSVGSARTHYERAKATLRAVLGERP